MDNTFHNPFIDKFGKRVTVHATYGLSELLTPPVLRDTQSCKCRL